MRYSNLRYFEVPRDDLLAQQEQLRGMRNEQYRQYFETGAAERTVRSRARTNTYASKTSLTEGTILYPFRYPQWNLSRALGESIYADAKIIRSSTTSLDPLEPVIKDRNTENYVYWIGRIEPHSRGYSAWSYAAGLVFDQPSAEKIGVERYIPFPGLEVADVQLIDNHLAQIAAIAVEKSLDIIDPLTLCEGYGLLIGDDEEDSTK